MVDAKSTGGTFAVADDVFGPPTRISIPSSPNLGLSSPNLAENGANGCLIAGQLLHIDSAVGTNTLGMTFI